MDSTSVEKVNTARLVTITAGGAAVMGGSLIMLDQAWYAQYERSRFHFFNDGGEWAQMDKAGHAFSSYWIGRWAQGLTGWAGVERRAGAWVGFATANLFLAGVELLDAHSAAWGFSSWDMVANLAGSGLFLGQELGWGEQKIKLKYSSWPSQFADQRPELLGASFGERILKDYNGHTLWATMALGAVRPRSHWTDALGLAIGYGAEGMLTADPDRTALDEVITGQVRYRQYVLSFDLDLERIPTRSKALRTALFLLNCIKIPAPAVEFRSNGGVIVHGLYF